jgi:Uri superfamily endonuclease
MRIDQGNMVINKTITLHLTPRAWHLYTTMKFVELVADYLNKHVADAFNHSETKAEALTQAELVLENVREFGATDTEPREVLYSLADKFFGGEK